MVSRIPQSSKGAFRVIQEIVRMGTVDIPSQFRGTGAPGDTLEFLLNVERNNFDSPDLKDWEVKFHGGNSLLTLFHKDPQPRGIMNQVVNAFGWPNKKGQISFRHTIKGKSERGFVVDNVGNKITVTFKENKDIIPYWDNNIILGAIGAKLRRLILVHGTVSKDKKQVIYESANAYWDLDLTGICEAIKAGTIYIDFDARTTGGKGTSLRNHGTKFRIHINDIGVIYENSQLIV
jgi:MvaI/BcnI restriction endonuclease family protein